MGAVFAAATRAPITAVLIIFELTGDYNLILPLMFAIVVATALASAVTRDTIYTLKLRRRGIDIDQHEPTGLMAQITVADAMGIAPAPLRADQPLSELVQRFAARALGSLPVADPAGRADRRPGRRRPPARRSARTAGRPGSPPRSRATLPALHAADSLEHAMVTLAAGGDDGLPVIGDDRQIVGWLTHRHLLDSYREHTAGRGSSAFTAPPAPPQNGSQLDSPGFERRFRPDGDRPRVPESAPLRAAEASDRECGDRNRELTKTFGQTIAVERLDLRVEPGQVFGFLGPNGAGQDDHDPDAAGPPAPERWQRPRARAGQPPRQRRDPRALRLSPRRAGAVPADDRAAVARLVRARPRRGPGSLRATSWCSASM